MSRYGEWCPVCKEPIIIVTRGIPSMGTCVNRHTTDRRDTLRREPVNASALTAAMELPEVQAMIEALEQVLIEYDDLDNAEPQSMTSAVIEARAALAAIKEPKL